MMVSLQTAVPWEAALENLWTLKHPSSAAERVAEIVLVFIFYWALHFTASFALRQWLLGHRYYSKLSYEKQCLAAEKFCSTVNAVLLGSISLISVFIREDYKADVFKTFPPLAEHMLCLFVAYSTYDTMTMFIIGDHWTMWAHHLITLFGACGMLTFREGSFWTTLFGITEFTAFTHNIVWYLQKVLIDPTDAMKRVDRINKNIPPPRKTEGLLDPSTLLVPLFAVVRLASFILLRIWVGPYSVYYPLRLYKFDWMVLITELSNTPIICAIFIPFIAAVLTLLNVAWTLQMTKLTLILFTSRSAKIKRN